MPDEAEIERLYRRVREEPRSTAFVGLGDALRRAGRLSEGLQVLREGFRVHPDHPAARVVLARIHLEMGNRPLATEVLEEVVRGDAENLAAASLLARIYVDDGRPMDARPLIERLRLGDHPDAAHRDFASPGAGADGGDPRSADPFDLPSLADRLARAGHYRRAWGIWERLAAANPGSATARERLAALERTLAGLPDALDSAPVAAARRALPGLEHAHHALLDDTRDRPAPAGHHPVARWGRIVWRFA